MFNIIRDLASAYESLSYLLSQPAGLLFTQCGTGMDRTTLMWHWISGTGYGPGTECEQRDPRDVSDGLARAVEASGGLAQGVEASGGLARAWRRDSLSGCEVTYPRGR
jgi:hypothetical protein